MTKTVPICLTFTIPIVRKRRYNELHAWVRFSQVEEVVLEKDETRHMGLRRDVMIQVTSS